MEGEYISRYEHDEFAHRMDEENSRQNHRLEVLEMNVKNITDLTVSVKEMAVQLKHMVIEQEKQGQRLEKIEASDGIMWRTVSTHAITAFVGGAIAFIVSKLF